MEIDYIAIGKRIRRARQKRKLTQRELAEKVGASEAHISNIEHGKKPFSFPLFMDICNTLNVTPDSLLLKDRGIRELESDEKLMTKYQNLGEKRLELTSIVEETIAQWWDENVGSETEQR